MARTNIIFTGEGGQGVQTIAEIFAKTLNAKGFEVGSIPSFGVEQRGTPSTAFISFSDSLLRQPTFSQTDYLVILSERALHLMYPYTSKKTVIVFDSSTVSSAKVSGLSHTILGVPATKIAGTHFSPKTANLILLGAISKLLKLDSDLVWSEVIAKLGKKFKTKEIESENKKAFEYGYEMTLETKDFSKADFRPKARAIIIRNDTKIAEVVPARCKGCGICIAKCPVSALSFGDELGVFSTPVPICDLEKCITCGNCLQYCPDGAIRVTKLKVESKK